MASGIIGVVVCYIIVVGLLTWFIILARGKYLLKFCAIFFSIWFAVGLYYLLPSMAGWPTTDGVPDGSIIMSIRIQEPTADRPGAFFFWVNPNEPTPIDVGNALNPKRFFIYTGKNQPRAYILPYDRELHKKIAKAQKEKSGTPGSWMKLVKGKKGKRGKRGKQNTGQPEFKIINPVDILTKPK